MQERNLTNQLLAGNSVRLRQDNEESLPSHRFKLFIREGFFGDEIKSKMRCSGLRKDVFPAPHPAMTHPLRLQSSLSRSIRSVRSSFSRRAPEIQFCGSVAPLWGHGNLSDVGNMLPRSGVRSGHWSLLQITNSITTQLALLSAGSGEVNHACVYSML